MASKIDLTGKRYHQLTVINFAGMNNGGGTSWNVICDCGTEKIVSGSRMKNGNTKSCGCLRISKLKKMLTTHGMSGTRMHKVWKKIRGRCLNPNNPGYKNYGGRGITICKRWSNFEKFYADMGECPPGMSIERVDNSRGYSPDNCVFADAKTQANNKRNNRYLTHKGTTLKVSQWAKKIGISREALDSRIKDGWDIKRAIETPRQRIYLGRKKKGIKT